MSGHECLDDLATLRAARGAFGDSMYPVPLQAIPDCLPTVGPLLPLIQECFARVRNQRTHFSTLVALVGGLFPLVGGLIAAVGGLVPLVGTLVPLVGTLVPLVGTLVPLVGTLVPLVGTLVAPVTLGGHVDKHA